MNNVPHTYAQFGEQAGEIMWEMHQQISRIEVEREEWKRRAELMQAAMDHVHYPRNAFFTIWHAFLNDHPEAEAWFANSEN